MQAKDRVRLSGSAVAARRVRSAMASMTNPNLANAPWRMSQAQNPNIMNSSCGKREREPRASVHHSIFYNDSHVDYHCSDHIVTDKLMYTCSLTDDEPSSSCPEQKRRRLQLSDLPCKIEGKPVGINFWLFHILAREIMSGRRTVAFDLAMQLFHGSDDQLVDMVVDAVPSEVSGLPRPKEQ